MFIVQFSDANHSDSFFYYYFSNIALKSLPHMPMRAIHQFVGMHNQRFIRAGCVAGSVACAQQL